jgi:hypothetical protein
MHTYMLSRLVHFPKPQSLVSLYVRIIHAYIHVVTPSACFQTSELSFIVCTYNTCIHTYIHAYITSELTFIVCTYNTCVHIYIYIYIYIYMHDITPSAYVDPLFRPGNLVSLHLRTIHTYIHTYMHTYLTSRLMHRYGPFSDLGT